MTEKSDYLSITLKFGSWTLPMTIRREDEYTYRQAEKLIKERYNYYTSSYRNQSTEMYLVMTILDLAVKVKMAEAKDSAEPIISRLTPLLEELESVVVNQENKKKK